VEDFPVKIVIVLAVILVALSSFPLISQQISPHEASASPTRSTQPAMQNGAKQDARAIASPAPRGVVLPKMDSSVRQAHESTVLKAARREPQSVGAQPKGAGGRSSALANQAGHAQR
jgi:hypothetical protein